MARKILTIGVTINLERYENLRLEVQGEVGKEGDTEELVTFLDGMLARLGHGDEATAERVEAYRRRVLASPGSAVTGAVPDWQVRGSEGAAPGHAPAGVPPEPVSGAREPAPPEVPKEAAPAKEDAPAAPVMVRASQEAKAVRAAAKPPAPAEGAAPAAARVPEPKKAPAPVQPKEAPREAPKPEKPVVAEGEVACEGCGASITRNQEKLSRLLTGKALCKKCMNP